MKRKIESLSFLTLEHTWMRAKDQKQKELTCRHSCVILHSCCISALHALHVNVETCQADKRLGVVDNVLRTHRLEEKILALESWQLASEP